MQLEQLFENCQSLLSEMRDVTVQVAGNIGEAARGTMATPATKSEPHQRLEQQLESFGKVAVICFNFPMFMPSFKFY